VRQGRGVPREPVLPALGGFLALLLCYSGLGL